MLRLCDASSCSVNLFAYSLLTCVVVYMNQLVIVTEVSDLNFVKFIVVYRSLS